MRKLGSQGGTSRKLFQMCPKIKKNRWGPGVRRQCWCFLLSPEKLLRRHQRILPGKLACQRQGTSWRYGDRVLTLCQPILTPTPGMSPVKYNGQRLSHCFSCGILTRACTKYIHQMATSDVGPNSLPFPLLHTLPCCWEHVSWMRAVHAISFHTEMSPREGMHRPGPEGGRMEKSQSHLAPSHLVQWGIIYLGKPRSESKGWPTHDYTS